MEFKNYIGIDYSGAKKSTSRLPYLRVYRCSGRSEPREFRTSASPANQNWNWTRTELTDWLIEQLNTEERTIVGIDHAFSFPVGYFERYQLKTWVRFLEDFSEHWPTHEPGITVDDIRKQEPDRVGVKDELRLTETWTPSAKSVFQFDVQGQVAKSTHAGIPWLRHIRKTCGSRIHFWPFDGWKVPKGRSVVAEVYPSLFRRRYGREDRNADQHDAYVTAQWLREADTLRRLQNYFSPPLTAEERRIAKLEGWILGVC